MFWRKNSWGVLEEMCGLEEGLNYEKSSLSGELNIENSLFLGELLGELDKDAGFKINEIWGA